MAHLEHVASPATIVTRWFVFTDIEGSTQRWERLSSAMPEALVVHDRILLDAVHRNHGSIVKHTGDGVFASFTDAADAVRAAVAGQRALAEEDFSAVEGLRVRIGVHGGAVHARDGDYFGPTVNRAARVMDAGHGGQIVVTNEVVAAAAGQLDDEITFTQLGRHRLKGLADTVALALVQYAGHRRIDAPLRTQNTTAGNLATPIGTLIGREELVAQLLADLDDRRLLSLVGPGGVGKTALAVHLAHRARASFADGVWFCDLAAVSDVDTVAAAVAATFGISRRAPLDLLDTMREALAGKSLLVVIDNCEHVLTGAAAAVTALTAAPGVRVLATTRQALGISGEHRVRVAPLDTARAAVDLFVDRAAAAGHLVTDLERPVVEKIVAELDGLPLAIELAAARTAVFTVEAVADRLGQRLRLLRGGVGDARHQALIATLEWSYALLEPDQRRMFDTLGSFQGGFDLEAVAAVTGMDEFDAADMLDSLIARSLVDLSADTFGAGRRFRLLETVRHYAVERLAASPAGESVASAHADHFASLVTAGRAGWATPAAVTWIRRLHADLANIRLAFTVFLRCDPARAATMVRELWPLWTSRSMPDEGARWMREAADALPVDHPIRGLVIDDLASMEWTRGSTTDAERGCREAIAAAEAAGVEPRLTVLVRLASVCASTGRRPEALALIEHAVRLYRNGHEVAEHVEILSAAAAAAAMARDHVLAKSLADEGVASARHLGPGRLASALFNAAIAYVQTRPQDAEAAASEGLAIATELGSRYGQGNALYALSLARLAQGKEMDAVQTIVDSLPPLRDSGQRSAVFNAVDLLIPVLLRQRHLGAVTLAAAGAAVRSSVNDDPDLIARRRERIVTRLPDDVTMDEFDAAWNRGLGMTLDEAVDEAIRLAEAIE